MAICTTCNGSGTVSQVCGCFTYNTSNCQACGGSGYEEATCASCNGSGNTDDNPYDETESGAG